MIHYFIVKKFNEILRIINMNINLCGFFQTSVKIIYQIMDVFIWEDFLLFSFFVSLIILEMSLKYNLVMQFYILQFTT